MIQALKQGKQLLPELLNSKDNGAGTLRRLGIDRAFVDEMYRKYGRFVDKVPGINRGNLDSAYYAVADSIEQKNPRNKVKTTSFDKTKYPAI